MELYFGNNIRNLRKNADITQDALAGALGVSAQSVSKWECGYGFPDITQLPAIANYFGVTIDELFSNSEKAKEAIKEEFIEKVHTFKFASEEKIEFIQKYCRKYPKDMHYLCWLCASVSDCIMANSELYDKYMPTMHSTVEALLDTEYRQTALANMLRVCKEEDVEKWLKKCAYNQNYTRRALLIDRYISKRNTQLWFIHQGISKLENLSTLLDERFPDQLGAVRKAEYQRSILAIMRSFGKDGNVPDGWLYLYGYKQLVLSACLFGAGKKDEAWEEFEGGIEKFKRWYSHPDKYLALGGELFANLKLNKNGSFVIDTDGNEYKLFGRTGIISDYNDFLYGFLTDPRWAWFNSARTDKRFISAVEWAKSLCDIPNDIL